MLNLSKLSITEGNDTYDFATHDASNDEIMKINRECVHQYQSAFAPKNNGFLNYSEQHTIVNPSMNHRRTFSKKRLKRKSETFKSKNKISLKVGLVNSGQDVIRVTKKRGASCSFCGMITTPPHTTNSCSLRKVFKTQGREYEISDRQVCNDVLRRFQNNIPLAKEVSQTNVICEITQSLQRKHIVLHEVYSNHSNQLKDQSFININELSFNVSFISSNGHVTNDNKNIILSGSCMNTIVTIASNLKTVKRYLYDNTQYNVKNTNWNQRKTNEKEHMDTLTMSQSIDPDGYYANEMPRDGTMNKL
jgi:hypothetical protein